MDGYGRYPAQPYGRKIAELLDMPYLLIECHLIATIVIATIILNLCHINVQTKVDVIVCVGRQRINFPAATKKNCNTHRLFLQSSCLS
jgi:hypothetical protein